jgi:hypothetical protein
MEGGSHESGGPTFIHYDGSGGGEEKSADDSILL